MLRERKASLAQFPHTDSPRRSGPEKGDLACDKLAAEPPGLRGSQRGPRFGMCVNLCVCVCVLSLVSLHLPLTALLPFCEPVFWIHLTACNLSFMCPPCVRVVSDNNTDFDTGSEATAMKHSHKHNIDISYSYPYIYLFLLDWYVYFIHEMLCKTYQITLVP